MNLRHVTCFGFVFFFGAMITARGGEEKVSANVEMVLRETQPMKASRGQRLPLYLWQAMDVGDVDEATIEKTLQELDRRGIGLVTSWHPGEKDRDLFLSKALRVATVQTRLGLRVNVNANACLYSFYDGTPETAHIDDQGTPFWDDSFGGVTMGCPFTLESRKPVIRERIDFFSEAYRKAGVAVDFIFADWEIDGPISVNRSHAASMKCQRCRKNVQNIEDYVSFQKAMQNLRGVLQRDTYAQPILSRFPKALVGNYAVYPSDGLRYWYDYFEAYEPGQPFVADQKSKVRKWVDEFSSSGYTFSMPVIYTWYPTFQWYDFEDLDYRWFYNMLLNASSAGENAPAGVPVISFVHWHTTAPPKDADPHVKQFSGEKYQELLWHMLLRGTDTFFLWSPDDEAPEEIRLLHPVYAAAQEYGEFLDSGTPIRFEVPKTPGPVISGLKLKDRVLVRRTDFGSATGPVEIQVDGQPLKVPSMPRQCQVLTMGR